MHFVILKEEYLNEVNDVTPSKSRDPTTVSIENVTFEEEIPKQDRLYYESYPKGSGPAAIPEDCIIKDKNVVTITFSDEIALKNKLFSL